MQQAKNSHKRLPSIKGESTPNAERNWFAGGEHLGYDPTHARIVDRDAPFEVFLKREGDTVNTTTFLPGYPDGSWGWSKVLPYLPPASKMSKLFIEYLGMGDSDKPKDYHYSTAERADLVEAVWQHLSVQSTTVVAFDFSSLVILEILQRRLERAQRGEPASGPRIQGVFIFNGGLFTDGHSHPWYTTPVLRRLPERAALKAGDSFSTFKMIMKRVMWSKHYHVTDAEIRAFYDAMGRHDGHFYTAKAAGFVADHKAQGTRLDFGRIFKAYHDQFPFLIGGSNDDPFEHRQVDLTQKRLGGETNLYIERLPGGHLTTNEQPEALANLITQFQENTRR